MRRTEQVQGLRLMKFEEIYERTTARRLSQHEAASILGVSERTLGWREWFMYQMICPDRTSMRRQNLPAGSRLRARRVFMTAAWAGLRAGGCL